MDSVRETLECPCCGIPYEVEVTAHLDFAHPMPGGTRGTLIPRIVDRAVLVSGGSSLDVCSRCNQPCCPRCDSIAGEGVVACTRCTNYPDCGHGTSGGDATPPR